jgi:cytochrome d ubiquinol oxidase subunit I
MASNALAVVRPDDLAAARAQMGFSLAWHIVLACLGVGLPLLTVLVEWRGIRTSDRSYRLLAQRWARAMGVLFAVVGTVSGTILSFEMGLLWPGLMGRFGQVIGQPFAMEGIAFCRGHLLGHLSVRLGTDCRPVDTC